MLAGRLSKVAQRASSVNLTYALRPVSSGLIRQYSAPAQNRVERIPTALDLIPDEIFSKYNLPKNDQNLSAVRAMEMVREAEALITSNNEFDRAEAMLTGALDFIGKSGIKDPWIVGAAHANLAYALQQNYKYDAAMSNYGIGLQNLTQEPVKDPRFLGIRQIGFAELLSLQGEHGMAATTCQAAVAQLERVLKNDPLIGIAYSNLAAYRVLEGKANLAVTHAEKALAVLEATLGKHNDITRNCAVNLSKIYTELGRNEKVETLDSDFLEEDKPILPPKTGNYDPDYVQKLKKKWKQQGPRKIFDPPGLHRSASLSANSYGAFIESWTSQGLPISSAAAGVLSNEFKSIGYSHDQLTRFVGRPLPKGFRDMPEKYKTGFEHLKVKGITSLAAELDKQASLPPLLPEDVSISPDEWKAAAERQRAYRAEHGDPQFEAAQEEFSKSEEFFEGAEDEGPTNKRKKELFAEEEDADTEEQDKVLIGEEEEGETEIEEEAGEDEDELDRVERKTEAILDRLEQQDNSDIERAGWDNDTYDAYRASHGDPNIRESERKESEKWLQSKRGSQELSEEDTTIFDECSDEELTKVEDLLRNGSFTQEGVAQISRWLGRTDGLQNIDNKDNKGEDLSKRENARNPHYLKFKDDYLTSAGIPTTYDVLEEATEEELEEALLLEEDKIEGEMEFTEEEEAEIAKLEQQIKSKKQRAVVLERPTAEEVEVLAEMADVNGFDDEVALRTEDAALKYRERVRKQIADNAPATPDTEYEREEMKFEKQVDENLRNNLLIEMETEKQKRVEAKLVKNKGQKNPYDYNAEEDDVFEYGQKDNSTIKRSTAIKRAQNLGIEDALQRESKEQPKHGRLHDSPWHDDFESN